MRTILGRACLALSGIIAAWVVINLFDESRDITLPQVPPADHFLANTQDNGFFALVGIGEPEGSSPAERHAAGIARYRAESGRAVAYLQTPGSFSSSAHAASPGDLAEPATPALTAAFSVDSLCDWQRGPCLPQFEKQRARVEQQLEAHHWLHGRYVELYRATTFTMPVQDFAIVIMQPSPFRTLELGSALVRTAAGLAALDGRGAAALDALAADVRFQRQLLRTADSHFQTHAALSNLARDLSLLDEILARDAALRQTHGAVISDVLQPFTAAERNIGLPLDGLFAGSMHMIETMASGQSLDAAIAFSRPFFRQHAFVNAAWQRHGELKRMLTQTPGDNLEAALENWMADGKFPASGIWSAVRNPVGALLTQVMVPTDGGHLLLRHEVDAYQRMLAIRFGVLAADVPAPVAGFQSKPVSRAADGRTLQFRPAPSSRWPQHLARVALPDHKTP